MYNNLLCIHISKYQNNIGYAYYMYNIHYIELYKVHIYTYTHKPTLTHSHTHTHTYTPTNVHTYAHT